MLVGIVRRWGQNGGEQLLVQVHQVPMLLEQMYLPAMANYTRQYAAPSVPKKAGKDKGPRRTGETSKTHATGCALTKGETDPELKPDSEYPDWLWKLTETQATAKDLESRYQTQGLTVAELQRLWRLKNKERIKENNFLRAKK